MPSLKKFITFSLSDFSKWNYILGSGKFKMTSRKVGSLMVEGIVGLAMALMIEVAHAAFCALKESCLRLGSSEKRMSMPACTRRGRKN
jgi:hypothetical protein